MTGCGSIRFACTRCGLCCRDTIIPLTVEEAVSWATLTPDHDSGHDPSAVRSVGMSAQILIWDDQNEAHLAASMPSGVFEWWRTRTRTSLCGRLPVRVSLRLYAIIDGSCPHLHGTLCGAHGRRPLVCAAYPLEVNEPPVMRVVHPEATSCPADAWEGRLLVDGDHATDTPERAAYTAYQTLWASDQAVLLHLRDLLGLHVGAMPSDAEIIHRIDTSKLLDAVGKSRRRHALGRTASGRRWKIHALDPEAAAMLKSAGAHLESTPPANALIVPGLLWRDDAGRVNGARRPPSLPLSKDA